MSQINTNNAQNDIFTEIIQLIATILVIDEKLITKDTEFSKLGADSLDILEIIVAIEEHFEIDLEDDLCHTPNMIVNQIVKQKQ